MIGFWPACAIGLACSAAAANAPEADTRFPRFFQNVGKQPLEALAAPFQSITGINTRGGQFGGKNFFTGPAPDAFTNGLRTANTILMPHHVVGVDGVGFGPSSPFTLGDFSGQASKQAFEHTSSGLLLFGNGVINITSAALIKQEKTNTEARNNIRSFKDTANKVLNFARWNSGMVSTAVFGSAGSERG
jgi:hypothetical protein